jgi:hypothetical protein
MMAYLEFGGGGGGGVDSRVISRVFKNTTATVKREEL